MNMDSEWYFQQIVLVRKACVQAQATGKVVRIYDYLDTIYLDYQMGEVAAEYDCLVRYWCTETNRIEIVPDASSHMDEEGVVIV